MLNWIVIFLVVLAGVAFWFCKYLLPVITKRKAHRSLQTVIFPKGTQQKVDVMKTFHGFTKSRFTDDQIIDYFIKIKGLQNMSLCNKTDFWVRKYLLSPTDIKLNYFEQVKFYELFMNYPGKYITDGEEATNENQKETLRSSTKGNFAFSNQAYNLK